MYAVYIKKGSAPTTPTTNEDIINMLFGYEPEPQEQNKFYRTQVSLHRQSGFNYYSYNRNITRITDKLNRYMNEHNISEMYTQFKIPKHTGGFRTIDAPNEELKKEMREIGNDVVRSFKLLSHDSAFAYVKGRSVIDAVKEHQANKSNWFLKLDLHDFFGSCNEEFIVHQLSGVYPFAAGIQEDLMYHRTNTLDFLKALAHFACLDNKLPQGTPMSPWLTNIIMIEFDYKITKLLNNIQIPGATKQRYVYTRYADDMLISSKIKVDSDYIVNAIKELFINTPLTINETKTRYGSSSGRNWNLGIMYNKDNELTVGHKKKRQIKDNIYYFIKFKDNSDLSDCQWLQGNISWLQSVEPEYTKGLLQYYKDKFNTDVWQELVDKIKSFNN